MKKKCKDCNAVKSIDDFYGIQNECKECTKKRVRAYRAANIDKVREYDRKRGQDPKRKEDNKRRYHERVSTPEGRAKEWHKKKTYINSTKRAANIIIGNAIRDGKLIRQLCEKCGNGQNIHAHHEDYGKPFEVTWLCRSCHGKRHREINEERRK